MHRVMDSLPASMRAWANGLRALTADEIETIERTWQVELVGQYVDGIRTKAEVDEAWATWEALKADEIAYLNAT